MIELISWPGPNLLNTVNNLVHRIRGRNRSDLDYLVVGNEMMQVDALKRNLAGFCRGYWVEFSTEF